MRMYVLEEPRSFSISFARSLDISSEAISAKVQRARPTAYIFEWFISLFRSEIAINYCARSHLAASEPSDYALFERIGDKSEHLLTLIQKQHDPEITKPLVGKPGAGD